LGLLAGCHAAGPVALKVAKLKLKMMKHGYRVRAISAMEKQYDANHNGVIDPEEAMYLKQRLIYEESLKQWRKMDIDGDGVVDSAEYESAQEDAASK